MNKLNTGGGTNDGGYIWVAPPQKNNCNGLRNQKQSQTT